MSIHTHDMNSTTTSIYEHPSLTDYYLNLTPFVAFSFFFSALLLILNIFIFNTTASQLRARLTKNLCTLSTFLCAVYPVISLAAFVTLLIPKSWLVCHTVMHLSFTVSAVVFQRLCFRYVNSEASYLKETDGEPVIVSTPPCCCCCLCLPAITPTKTKLCILRYMILQMPFVQGSIMLVLNGIYYKEPELYRSVVIYFMPFVVSSILVGLWGLNITVRMVAKVHTNYALMKKMFCLQLILLLCKLQYLLLDNQLDGLVLGGAYPINHTIYKQTIINLLILSEMVMVSLLAQNAYKVPVEQQQSAR